MKDIREVSHPEIGKQYWVPMVRFKPHLDHLTFIGKDRQGWFPTRGPLHSDAELGFKFRHWHYDIRFFYRNQDPYDGIKLILNIDSENFGDNRGPALEMEPEMRRKTLNHLPRIYQFAPFLSHLETLHVKVAAETSDGCLTCPHRGFRLNEGDFHDGGYICPAHQLKWSREGRLIRHNA